MSKTICLLVLLAAAASLSAQTYKWRDASGTVQYSDTPPPSNAKDVQQLRKTAPVTPTPAAAGTSQPKPVADPEAEFRKRMAARQDAEAKQAKAQEDEATRVRHCEQAQAQLSALDSGNRVARYTATGERVALDDAERDQARAEAQKAIQTWCK
jgi:hypothetical protein